MQLLDKPASRTLRDEVVDIIREAIVSGKLGPGEHLKENVLAEQMSVSRSPIREALRQLEQEGLIASIPNQGSFVKVFDESDVEEIFALRTALENLACEIILREHKLTPADVEQTKLYIEQQRAAIKARDFERLTELDMGFHEFICKKSRSERLLKMWRSLRAQIQVLFYQRFLNLDWVPDTVDTDHMCIINALSQEDAKLVCQVNKEINERVARECKECLELIQAGGED